MRLDSGYLLLVVPALILSLIAQLAVKSAYKKYGKIANSRGLTGAMAAQMVLNFYGINDVRINHIGGNLTDHFNPSTKEINLSDGVYDKCSIAAVGIAAHEAGHAAQHAQDYAPIKFRNSLIPICNIGSRFGFYIAIFGAALAFRLDSSILMMVAYAGVALYAFAFIFHLVTLPVEFNASMRALSVIEESGLLMGEELSGACKMLTAAAMTYVAAMIASLANLLRLLMIVNRKK